MLPVERSRALSSFLSSTFWVVSAFLLAWKVCQFLRSIDTVSRYQPVGLLAFHTAGLRLSLPILQMSCERGGESISRFPHSHFSYCDLPAHFTSLQFFMWSTCPSQIYRLRRITLNIHVIRERRFACWILCEYRWRLFSSCSARLLR